MGFALNLPLLTLLSQNISLSIDLTPIDLERTEFEAVPEVRLCTFLWLQHPDFVDFGNYCPSWGCSSGTSQPSGYRGI